MKAAWPASSGAGHIRPGNWLRYGGRDPRGRRIGHTLYVHQTPWPGTLPSTYGEY